MEGSGLVDMGRKDDADRAFGGAGNIAAGNTGPDAGRIETCEFMAAELGRSPLVDDTAWRAGSLGGAAGEVTFDVGANADAASERKGKSGGGKDMLGECQDDQPLGLDGAAVRKARSASAGRKPSITAPSNGRTMTGVPPKP